MAKQIKNNSDSSERLEIENIVRTRLLKKLEVDKLSHGIISLGGVQFQVDFYNEQKSLYGEIYAGIDTLKPGQLRKVGMDILKLLTIGELLGKPIEKHLVFTDEAIKKRFENQSWYSKSVDVFRIKTICVELTKEEQLLLKAAKKRQYMGTRTMS